MISAADEQSFIYAMQVLGVQPHNDQTLVPDGQIHRYRIDGDKSGSLNGWYVLYPDGLVPAGAFGSWKTGESQNWCAKSEQTLSPAEREAWRKSQAEAKAAREAAKAIVQQESRMKAAHLWGLAHDAIAIPHNLAAGEVPKRVHPYILNKGIKPFGVKQLNDSLVVPIRNASGTITSLQFIQADGAKKFLTGGEIAGGYFAIGRHESVLCICEGLATGASIREATGYMVAVAFNAGNLAAVAKVMREKFPAYTILICADNDVKTETNMGLSKATDAAGQIHAMLAYAKFQESVLLDGKVPTDFNDLHRLQGLDAVRDVINASLNSEAIIDAVGGEAVRAEKVRHTRQSLTVLIDACDDFEVLTTDYVMQVALGEFSRPTFEFLLSRIAKKAHVPKSALLEVIKTFDDGGDTTQNGNESEGRIDELNFKHAILPMGGRILVMNREYDPVMERQLLTFSAKSDFETRYCNRKMYSRGEEVGLGTYWLNHARRAEFDGMVFSPGEDQPGYLNLWSGWGVDPAPGSCQTYLDFVFDVIASGNADLFNYIIYWIAHLVQRPQELPETALVFRGYEGTGKNTFVDWLQDIVGGEHCLMLSSLNQVTGRFSGHLANTLLVFCNESIWGGDKSAQGVLKSMITDKVQPIEHKGRDLFMVNSYRRMIFATNENWAVPRGSDDRRYVITDVSASKKGDTAYFKAIREERANGGPAALMHYLLSIDIDDWHPRQIPIQLQVCGWELKIRSGGSIVQWWFDMLQQGWLKKLEAQYGEDDVLIWPSTIPIIELQHAYLAWCTAYKITHPEVDSVVGKSLAEWGLRKTRPNKKGGGHRPWFYKLPTLEDAQAEFSARFTLPPGIWEGDDESA